MACSFLGFANEKSSEMAMDSGCFAAKRETRDFKSAGEAAVRISPLPAVRDERLDAVEEEIVELGTGLPSDLDGVFETGGGDQRGAGAFAFEQRVGADGRAVQDY
jgi:hypothetical protein